MDTSLLLQGKICLVTGASRGIGAGIIRKFAEHGATVFANARINTSFDEVCSNLTDTTSGIVKPVYFDVTDTIAMREAFLAVKKECGSLDVLVNNAGIMRDARIGMISQTLMDETFRINVFAVIEAIQLATKLMVRQQSGSIINIASLVGVVGNEGQSVYAASKGAIVALTKASAKELASNNIRVNAVAPGVIDTDLFKNTGTDVVEEFTSRIRMGRLGTPEDIANVCVFLASDLSQYTTGQIIGVDGAVLM